MEKERIGNDTIYLPKCQKEAARGMEFIMVERKVFLK